MTELQAKIFKYTVIAALTVVLFFTLTSSKEPVKPVTKVTSCVVVATMNDAKVCIEAYCNKGGWTLKHTIEQSISVSVNSRTNSDYAYNSPYKESKGQVLLVFEK